MGGNDSVAASPPGECGLSPGSRRWTVALLAMTYALVGIMMNSVGTVILQAIRHFDATKPMASSLEACKDLTVVVASFLLATRVPTMGYRRTLVAVTAALAIACLLASFATRFWGLQLLFVATGAGFALAKVATYASIGLVAHDRDDHAGITTLIEGVFMIGILVGIWLFGAFIAADASGRGWLGVYRLLAACFALAAVGWLSTPLAEAHATAPDRDRRPDTAAMVGLAILPATVSLLGGLFLYVLVEQSVGTWLPTFNAEVLHLPAAMSVQLAGIFVGASAVGRLLAGPVLRRIGWLPVLVACLAAVAALIVLTLPLARNVAARPGIDWLHAPAAAYMFPLIGVFLAPVYPTLCSVALSALPAWRQAAMTGLIVVFSALGGTIGSYLTSLLFQHLPGSVAFYFALVPIALLAAILPVIRRRERQAAA